MSTIHHNYVPGFYLHLQRGMNRLFTHMRVPPDGILLRVLVSTVIRHRLAALIFGFGFGGISVRPIH
jgi:hypothetical protein